MVPVSPSVQLDSLQVATRRLSFRQMQQLTGRCEVNLRRHGQAIRVKPEAEVSRGTPTRRMGPGRQRSDGRRPVLASSSRKKITVVATGNKKASGSEGRKILTRRRPASPPKRTSIVSSAPAQCRICCGALNCPPAGKVPVRVRNEFAQSNVCTVACCGKQYHTQCVFRFVMNCKRRVARFSGRIAKWPLRKQRIRNKGHFCYHCFGKIVASKVRPVKIQTVLNPSTSAQPQPGTSTSAVVAGPSSGAGSDGFFGGETFNQMRTSGGTRPAQNESDNRSWTSDSE